MNATARSTERNKLYVGQLIRRGMHRPTGPFSWVLFARYLPVAFRKAQKIIWRVSVRHGFQIFMTVRADCDHDVSGYIVDTDVKTIGSVFDPNDGLCLG